MLLGKKISNAPIFRIGSYNRLFGSVVNIGLKKKVGPQVVRLKKNGDVKESPSKFGPRRHRSHEYRSEMSSSNRWIVNHRRNQQKSPFDLQ